MPAGSDDDRGDGTGLGRVAVKVCLVFTEHMTSLLRVTVAALATGATLFIWNALLWAVPAHQLPVGTVTDDRAAARGLLDATGGRTGTFFVGDPDGSGPAVPTDGWAWLTVHDDYSLGTYVAGSLAVQLVVGTLLVLWWRGATGLRQRLVRAAGGAATASAAGVVWYANWGWFSPSYAAVGTFDLVSGWLLAAVVAHLALKFPRAAPVPSEKPLTARSS